MLPSPHFADGDPKARKQLAHTPGPNADRLAPEPCSRPCTTFLVTEQSATEPEKHVLLSLPVTRHMSQPTPHTTLLDEQLCLGNGEGCREHKVCQKTQGYTVANRGNENGSD